jgi:hypothetical protein
MIRRTRTSPAPGFLLRALSFIFLLGATATAQNGSPPLIDREVLFGSSEIAGAQLSPDGKFVAFRKPHKGTVNIWVKRADEPFDSARLLTNEGTGRWRKITSFCGRRCRTGKSGSTRPPTTR